MKYYKIYVDEVPKLGTKNFLVVINYLFKFDSFGYGLKIFTHRYEDHEEVRIAINTKVN